MAWRSATKLGSFAALAFLFLTTCLEAQTPVSSTGIEGVVTIGPIHGGPVRVDEPSSKPYANMTFDVLNDAGIATSFTTDSSGRFHVALTPGRYSIKAHDSTKRFPRCGPFQIEITASGFQNVAWQCDTGMR